MIRFTCPHCTSKLSAKEKLVGQVRKCPNCGQPVHIVADEAAETEPLEIDQGAADQEILVAVKDRLPSQHLPERLDRESHYVICDKVHVVAAWANDGRGWMFRSGPGFISAKRCRAELTPEGDFKLIDLKFAMTPDGKRLYGVTSYQLALRWALTTLDESDDAICGRITGLGALNRDQKYAVRSALKEQFMRDVWEHSSEVLEYLANTDFHSPGAGGEPPASSGLPRVSMVDFLRAVVYVNGRIPRGFDFALHVFQTANPHAAQSIVGRERAGKPAVEAQSLGAFGLSGEAFVSHARELARDEDPNKSLQPSLIVVQEQHIDVESHGRLHTMLCSFFRSKEAKEVVLPPGQSLDGLLR